MKLKIFNLVLKAIFAGICIGIAGWGFLVDKTLGIFLFIFGLTTVILWGVMSLASIILQKNAIKSSFF